MQIEVFGTCSGDLAFLPAPRSRTLGLLMRHLIEYGRNKLDDPILMTWALRRYEHARVRGSDLCRSMEGEWFHDLALRHWINSSDQAVLEKLFGVLPPQLFANVRTEILDRWATWSGGLGARATSALMQCPPQEVIPLIARHIDGNLLDYPKTLAVIAAMVDLPASNARELLDEVSNRVSELQEKSLTMRMVLPTLLSPTAALSGGNLVRLVETCARATRDDKAEGGRLLQAIYSALFSTNALLKKAGDLMHGKHTQPLRSLRPLFSSGAPLEECDRILLQSDPWRDAEVLLDKHRAASSSTESAFAVIKVVQSLDASDHGDMACFAIAAVLQAFKLEEIDVSNLSMDEALDILTLDVSGNGHLQQLRRRLGALPPPDTARAVGTRMPIIKDQWGGVHLATLAGELRLVDTIPMLIDCLDEDTGGFLCEAAQRSLVQIGAPAELALIARWDQLDRSQKIYGLGALEQIGGEATCRFAIERFQELFRDDHGSWCALIEALPNEQAIKLLEPEVGRKQPSIDECFYRLCVLTGYQADSLEEVRARVTRNRQRTLERRSAFAAGDFSGSADTMTLTLKCERCGDVNRYDIKSLIIGKSHTGPSCFVGDDLRCASCDRWADFEFTAETHMQMMAAVIRLTTNQTLANRVGPVRPMSVLYRREKRPAPEVMAELKAAVAEHPEDIVNHLRLARLQYVIGRRGRAAECYAAALAMEPDSLEAALGVARIMADAGDRGSAFDRLSEILQRKSQWRFFRTDEVSPQVLIKEFVRLFNTLHSGLGVVGRPLLPTSFPQSSAKVGRNAPCPCGSGKKYKKCCGDAQAAMVH